MPIHFLRSAKNYLVRVCQLALLLASASAIADKAYLAPGLELPLPSALALEVIRPQEQFNGEVIVGEVNNAPGYFIAASKANAWEKNAVLWKRLESGIRMQSDNDDFVMLKRGNFYTHNNNLVWFRAYAYQSAEQTHRQVYFLLKNQNTVYWITLTMTETVDINLTIPITTTLIQRARILQPGAAQ